jgi:hypothetical protein
MKELCKGLTVEKNRNGFTIMRLHYTADPKKDLAWAQEMKRGYLTDIWNQEMELDFTKATGKRVFPEFMRELHVREIEPIVNETVWRGWDFGYTRPACVWFQIDKDDSLCILAEMLGHNTVIDRFASDVKKLSAKMFHGFNFKDAGDPAVRAKSDKSKRTSADILRSMNIRIETRPSFVRDGINTIRTLLLPRPDGEPRLKVHPRNQLLISGFMGEYLRNEDTDEPIKDGYMEHLFDALRYGVIIVFNPRTFERFRPVHMYVRPRPTAMAGVGY